MLEPGVWVSETVGNQDARFYKIKMSESMAKNGVMIKCKSYSVSQIFKKLIYNFFRDPSSSWFCSTKKVTIFEEYLLLINCLGGARIITESQKRKKDVSAELYFVPFERVNVGEFIPMRHYLEDKEVSTFSCIFKFPMFYRHLCHSTIWTQSKHKADIHLSSTNTFFACMVTILSNP